MLRTRALLISIATVGLGFVGAAPAQAHDGDHSAPAGPAAHAGSADHSVPAAAPAPATGTSTYFAARLTGRQEVPVAGGPAVGDPEGRATALVKVQGARVTFSLSWRGITAPTLGHIHRGATGANGPVAVTLLGSPMPDTVSAAAGSTSVTDSAVAAAIRSDPAAFYVNLHSAEFPGGAVRGQLRPARPFNPLRVLPGGSGKALLTGDQEVPAADGKATDDPDAAAVAFLRPAAERISYSAAWVGTSPTLLHVHRGRFGTNGPVVALLAGTPMPSTVFAVAGALSGVDRGLVREIRRHPSRFYVNLHSAEFPGGAARGQLF
jgi:CHRD domain